MMYKTIKNASKRMVNLLRLDRFFIIYGNRQGINSLSRDDLLSRNPMVMHFRPVTEQPPQFIDRAPTQRLPPAGWGGAPRSSPPQFMRNVSGHEGYGDRSASGRSNNSRGHEILVPSTASPAGLNNARRDIAAQRRHAEANGVTENGTVFARPRFAPSPPPC